MAINQGPKIVKDGLVLCLDAANAKSYPGSGTVWRDLSGNGYDASIVGSVVFNSAYSRFEMADNQITDYIILPYLALQNLTSGTTYTIELITVIDNTDTEYILSCEGVGYANNYLLQKSPVLNPYLGTLTDGSRPSISAGELIHLTIVNNAGETYFYKNGNYSATFTGGSCSNSLKNTEGWVLNQEQDSVLGGFAASQCTAMKTSIVRLYDKALSASEVKQNYSITESRFGL